MKISKILFLSAILFSVLTFTSCGSGVDCDDMAAVEAALEPEFDALIEATNAYSADPDDSDNCNDFKNAIEDFVKASRDLEDCVPAEDLAEYRNDLEELENQADMLEC